jgi:hypothetical protein
VLSACPRGARRRPRGIPFRSRGEGRLATFLSLTCAPSAVRVGLLPARGLHHRAHRPIGAARWGDRGPRGLGLHLGPDLRVRGHRRHARSARRDDQAPVGRGAAGAPDHDPVGCKARHLHPGRHHVTAREAHSILKAAGEKEQTHSYEPLSDPARGTWFNSRAWFAEQRRWTMRMRRLIVHGKCIVMRACCISSCPRSCVPGSPCSTNCRRGGGEGEGRTQGKKRRRASANWRCES